MPSSTSFIVQIANLNIEICGWNDKDSACLRDLRRIFVHHEVSDDNVATHRIVVCSSKQFAISPEAIMQWASPCLGVADMMPHRRSHFLARLFCRNKEIPRYSGTCDVICYKDNHRDVEYFMTKNAEWRIEHHAKEHVTYVYSDKKIDMSDGLPSMLIHVVGSQYGCYLLFASCVAVDGKASLFTGGGGVGKTTLCMDLIKKGASYIGDDLVVIYRDGEKTMVGSLLFPLKYYANKINSNKKEIDLVPDNPVLNAPLEVIYCLKRTGHTGAEPNVVPMRDGEMFEKMLKLTNKANTNADARNFIDTLSFVCDNVPCYYKFIADHDQR